MTKLTKNGISTTRTPGQFAYEEYTRPDGRELVQWDYRAMDGKLYSGVALSLEAARQAAQKQSGEKIEGGE